MQVMEFTLSFDHSLYDRAIDVEDATVHIMDIMILDRCAIVNKDILERLDNQPIVQVFKLIRKHIKIFPDYLQVR